MRLHPCLLVFVLLFLCILPAVAVDFPVPTGTWQESGTLATPRSFATATLLRDGRILILGGKDASGNALASAEVFRPDGTVTSAPAMVTPRYGHSAALLADGRVLVAGGHTTGGAIVNTAEIFDPSANTWSAVPNAMTDPRADFTMSALTGGDVILIGGDNGAGTVESIDRFSLASGSFQFQAYLTAARKSHAASVLRDGRIVITGGVGQGGPSIPLSLTEIYDPVANSVTGGPALKLARFAHSSTTLVDGTVLIAGGGNGNADLASLEIFDPVANTMTTASATLATPRSGQVALMLPNNGGVLIAGGTSAGTALASSELYQSWNTAVLANGAMSAARQGATASALLADGTALVAAGSNLGSTDLYGFATVKTDAADYAPGIPVNVTGSGWVPGETVTLSLLESPLFDTHPNMTAVADPQGNIANSDFAPDTHDVNIRFYLTATGSKSQAYNTFTDANAFGTITVTPATSGSDSVAAGGTATYTVKVVFGSGSGCGVNLSIGTGGTGLPTDASAIWGTAHLSNNAGGTGTTQTTSLSITSSIVGSYTFSALASVDSTCPPGKSDATSSPAAYTVSKATPTITWTNPADIVYGMALGPIQLNATAAYLDNGTTTSVPGTFTYSPAAGTVLVKGSSQILSVHFVPTDTHDFATPADKTVSINVTPLGIAPSITAPDKIYDGTNAATFTCSLTGVLPADTANVSCTGGTATFASAGAATGINVTATGLTLTGSKASNYVLSSTTATTTASITEKSLTVSGITANSKVYDGNSTATLNFANAALQGVAGTDNVTLNSSTYSASFTDKTAANSKPVTVSGLALSGGSAANYKLTQPIGLTANITQKPLTVTGITANDKVYDGNTSASLNTTGAALGGVVSGDTVSLVTTGATATFSDKTAAPIKIVTIAGLSISSTDADNYSLTQPTTTATITQKPLTVSGITAADKIYDGTSSATLNTASAALVGIVSGDAVTVNPSNATGSFADKAAGPTKTVSIIGLLIGGNDSGNYKLTQPTTTATINPKNLTVSGITAANKVYDGGTTATLTTSAAALVGVVSGDTVTLSASGATGSFADKNVGQVKTVTISNLGISGADSTNYTFTQPTATASISAKPVTVTGVTANDKVYDGNTTATLNLASAALQALVTGDSVNLTTSGAAATFADKNVGPGKTVTITGLNLAGTDAGNYSLGQPMTTASITPKTITVTGITANNKTYDGNISATLNLGAAALQGTISGDSVTPATTSAVATFSDKNVGPGKLVTITGITLTGNEASNYSLTQPTTTASITPKTLTITGITANNKVYDGNNSASLNVGAAALQSVVSGDSVSPVTGSATATFSDKNAAPGKLVTIVGITLGGNDAQNYLVTQPTTTADISPKTLTATISVQNKVYDQTTAAVITSESLTGVISPDVVSISGGTAAFSDKNAGVGKTVNVGGLNLTGADAGNYTVAGTASTTANITPRTLNMTAVGVSKVYDGTTAATVTLQDNRLAGDVLTEAYSTATFADRNAAPAKSISVTGISVTGGADTGNYVLANTSATATADVTRRPLTVTASADDKMYDGNTTATAHLSDNRVSGDIFTDGDSNATFSDKNVGTGKTVTVSGISISGTDANNYNLTNPTATTTASITARQLVVTATGVSRTYDGTTAGTVTLADNRISGDTFTDAYTAAAFTDKNAGTAKIINVSGINISGADAANYIPNSTATATANITARPVTITAVADSKVYDATTTSTATPAISGDGLAAGDTASLSQSFDTKNVATGKALTAAGTIVDGNGGNNYQVTFVQSHAGVITQRALHVTATGVNKQYEGTPAATVTLSDDHIPSDAVTDGYISAAFSDKNVGTGKTVTVTGISISGADALNYTLASTSATTTASITQRALHVSATATDKQYDGTTTATVTLSDDRVSGDTLTDADTGATFSDKSVGAGKTVTVSGISISGTDTGNYNLASTTATTTASITARQLVITAMGVSRKYDGTTAETVTLADNRVSGDTFTDAYTTASFADKNVGTEKTINVGGINISGGDAANYIPNTTATATANITARPVTITAVADSKVYDATTTSTAAPAISGDGLAPGDTASLSEAFDNKNVGTGKTLTAAGTITDGNGGNNYQVTFTASQTGMITQRTIHVTATGIDKQYDGTMAATVTLTDDHLSGDAVTDAYNSAAFADKTVGTGKPVTVTGIAISGADAPNYALASTTATTTASITLRALTVTAAAADKVYDGTMIATVTLSDNRVSGDVLTDNSTSAMFADKNVGTGKTVTVNGISISGTDAGNYNLSNTSATATASITVRSIIVSGVTDTKVYDATTTSSGVPTITTGSLASGDTATFSQAFDNKNVGTTKALTPTGTISDGNGGANYNVTYTAATLGSITARPLTVRAATDSKIYDGSGASSGIPTITSGTLAGSDMGSFTQTFDNRNVGTGKILTPAGTVSDGNTGANYQVTFTAVNTGSISQRPITITAVVETKVYDGTLLSSGKPGITSGSLVSGDTATLSQAFSQSDAASTVILTPAIVIADGNGGNNYAVTVQTVSGTITKALQTITWATPSAITYGTALGSTQLNATVVGVAGGSVPGALTYTPASGTVPNPGSNQLQVAAAATNNYNAATATVNIAVSYSTAACDGDLGHAILQPINLDKTSTFKQGSTVPAKFRVCDAHGNSVGAAGVVKSFNIIQAINGTITNVVDQTVDSTTPDSSFRWDPTAQQWIFNISTKTLAVHTTYVFAIALNDGSVIQFQFGLPK